MAFRVGRLSAQYGLHRCGELDSEQAEAIKGELLEVFRPDARDWEARILELGALLVEQARMGLCGGT